MSDVFLSHSSKDKPIADKVCDFLEGKGLSCWIAPRNIVPGSDWAASISTAVTTCKVFLLIYSANSAVSDQVARELSLAESAQGVFVVPYKVDNTDLTGAFQYYLTGSHWVTANYAKKDYKLEELYNNIISITGMNVQNITNNTYIDNLHIHGGDGSPEQINNAVNSAIKMSNGGAPVPASESNAPAPAAKVKSKMPIILAAVCAVLVIGSVGAFLALSGNDDDDSSSEKAKSDISSSAVESQNDDSDDSSAPTRKQGEKTDVKIAFYGYSDCVGTYSGELNDVGVPDGKGTYKATFTRKYNDEDTTNELTYEGDFVNGVANGQGTSVDKYADVVREYVGGFDNNSWNGKGELTYTYSSGDYSKSVFKGTYTDCSMNGEGECTAYYNNGDIYVYNGEWKDSKKNGKGFDTRTFAADEYNREKQTREGTFVDGVFAGDNNKCTDYYKDGTYIVRTGKFENNEFISGTKETYDASGNLVKTENVEEKTALAAPSGFNVEFDGLTAKVTWDKVEGATGYESDIWDKTKQLKDPYINLNATEGTTTVLVKIRAVADNNGSKTYSDWAEYTFEFPSDSSSALSRPTNFKTTCKDGKATITWDEVKGATGYEYEFNGKTGDLSGEYASISNCKEGDETTVKFRAYTEKDGKRTYSDWTKITFTYKED